MFNLIPTEPNEYKVYADYLEDHGAILTTAVRKGILSFDRFPSGSLTGCCFDQYAYGDGGGYAEGSHFNLNCDGCINGSTLYNTGYGDWYFGWTAGVVN